MQSHPLLNAFLRHASKTTCFFTFISACVFNRFLLKLVRTSAGTKAPKKKHSTNPTSPGEDRSREVSSSRAVVQGSVRAGGVCGRVVGGSVGGGSGGGRGEGMGGGGGVGSIKGEISGYLAGVTPQVYSPQVHSPAQGDGVSENLCMNWNTYMDITYLCMYCVYS